MLLYSSPDYSKNHNQYFTLDILSMYIDIFYQHKIFQIILFQNFSSTPYNDNTK